MLRQRQAERERVLQSGEMPSAVVYYGLVRGISYYLDIRMRSCMLRKQCLLLRD